MYPPPPGGGDQPDIRGGITRGGGGYCCCCLCAGPHAFFRCSVREVVPKKQRGTPSLTVSEYNRLFGEWVTEQGSHGGGDPPPPKLPEVWIFHVGEDLPVCPLQLPVLQPTMAFNERLAREWRIHDPRVVSVLKIPGGSGPGAVRWVFQAKSSGRTNVTYIETYEGSRAHVDFVVIVM